MKITVTIAGMKGLQTAIKRISNIDGIFYNWMREGNADAIMHASFGKNFTQQGRPRWSKLAESTISNRKKAGYGSSPILFRTGNLRDEITNVRSRISRSGGVVTSTWDGRDTREAMKFSIHQKGISNIPARPMIGFQEDDGPKLLRDFSNFLGRQLQ